MTEKAWQTWHRRYEQELAYRRGYECAVKDIMSALKVSS